MKHIIDEEELKGLIMKVGREDLKMQTVLDEFLKSKQPVEEIASGIVTGKMVMTTGLNILEKFNCEDIKILIQEVQK